MSQLRPTILVIDDEPQIRRFLRATLSAQDFLLLEAETAEAGLREAASQPPDVVLLDLGLPDLDGMEVIQRLRQWTRVPIIILSARGQESDKVAALDLGADDYLTKPFSVPELMARIRVALRHGARGDADAEPLFVSDELKVDLAKREVSVSGKEIKLTPIEFRLLALLVKHAGKVVTQGQILKEVWGPGTTIKVITCVFLHTNCVKNWNRRPRNRNSSSPRPEWGIGFGSIEPQFLRVVR